MANGTTTTANPAAPISGGLNYADYQERIKQAAAKTRTVAGAGTPQGATDIVESMEGRYIQTPKNVAAQAQGQAAITNYQTQTAATQQQAEKAASALEMMGSSTIQGLKNLEAIQGTLRTSVQNVSDTWGAAAEKADEYVKASRGRVGEVLTKLDDTFKQFGLNRDFAKAHAMQASVQAVMGSMKTEERNIVDNYGTDSKEFAQFQSSKLHSLATVQSNIHASYQQLAEESEKTYMNAMSDSYTKSNMYVGFQKQQHVEMLKFAEQTKTSYALQATQLDVSIEQMKMAGSENLANWIVETPTFSMDSTPLMTLLSDISSTLPTQRAKPNIGPEPRDPMGRPIYAPGAWNARQQNQK